MVPTAAPLVDASEILAPNVVPAASLSPPAGSADAKPLDLPPVDVVDAVQGSRRELSERTHALLLQAAQSDPVTRQACHDEVITSHLWLARALSRRFRYRGEDEEDLWQVACTGLVEAVQRFDPEHGSFVAFAAPTILGLLKRHFRDHGWMIRPPRRTQELLLRVRRQWPEVAQSLGGVPQDQELAAWLGESVAELRQAKWAGGCYRLPSLDGSPSVEGAAAVTAGERETDDAEAHLMIVAAFAQIDDDERRLLWWRFFEDRSQADIALLTGTSQMQVSRLLVRLLAKLRGIVGELDQGDNEPWPQAS